MITSYNDYLRSSRELRLKYIKSEDRLLKELEAFQSQCPHKNKTYEVDPSGNNGGYWECRNCGSMCV